MLHVVKDLFADGINLFRGSVVDYVLRTAMHTTTAICGKVITD